MITEQQIERYSDVVFERASLTFYLWVKHNGWTYSESKDEWFNGLVRLSHTEVFNMFSKSCQNVTHVEASQNSQSVE